MARLTEMAWLVEPVEQRGLHIALDDGSWSFTDYRALAGRVAAAAGGLRAAGIGPGDRVGIALPTGVDFVVALFALWTVRAVPCPFAPPGTTLRGTAYADHVRALTLAAGMSAVVADTSVAALVDIPVLTDIESADRTGPVDPGAPPDIALIQFSAGSTAAPKGVAITSHALSAQLRSISGWLGTTAGTPSASWVPLHHDMGLIGCLLTPMSVGADVWLLRPDQFLRRPLRWLHLFGAAGAMMSATTDLGLAHVVRRVPPESLAGLDFSGWRALVLGAERIRPATVRSFVDLLRPFGLDPGAVLPAYGLAEATLAVTGRRRGSDWATLRVDPACLAAGRRVRPGAVEVTSCGPPLPGTTVRVVGEDGVEVPAGHLGEITVTGPSTTAGYVRDGVIEAMGRRLATGDAGFLADGELYVIGRMGDSLNNAGRLVFAEDLESMLRQRMPDLGNTVVLLGARADRDAAVVLVEHADRSAAEEVVRVLVPYLSEVDITVRRTPGRAVSRTTSGKPRRRHMWLALHEHTLAGVQLLPSPDTQTQARTPS